VIAKFDIWIGKNQLFKEKWGLAGKRKAAGFLRVTG